MNETIVQKDDADSGHVNVERSTVMRVQTPQAYRYDLIHEMYSEARRMGITESIYANTLLLELGGKVFFSKGSETNLKVTSRNDLDIIEFLIGKSSVRPTKRRSA